MADLVKYPAEVLQAVYKTHRHSDLDKVVSRIEQGQRRFYGKDVVLAVTLDLWDRDRLRIRLYQQERQVLRAIYVLAHQQNSIIVEFTPAQLMEVLGYAKDPRRGGDEARQRRREEDLRPVRPENLKTCTSLTFVLHLFTLEQGTFMPFTVYRDEDSDHATRGLCTPGLHGALST